MRAFLATMAFMAFEFRGTCAMFFRYWSHCLLHSSCSEEDVKAVETLFSRYYRDNYLKDMLKTPSLTVTVRQPYFRRGGSKDNPYLPPKYREYEMAIDPRKIAERLLEVRAHLATEMSMDLSLTRKENAELKRHHFEMVRRRRRRKTHYRWRGFQVLLPNAPLEI